MADRVVIVGGNAAGMTAASRAKRLDPSLNITILEQGPFISYSICGLPYYVEDRVREAEKLISFTPEKLQQERGIAAQTRVRVEEILTGRRMVLVKHLESGKESTLPYDRLVIATGYRPVRLDVPGQDLGGVLTVSRLEEGLLIRDLVGRRQCRRVAVVGGGYVGLMMAHALRGLGLEVHLLEQSAHLFGRVDDDIAELLEKELREKGVRLRLKTKVTGFEGGPDRFVNAVVFGQERLGVDLVVVDVGVRPNVDLALKARIACGRSGAIAVDSRGQTDTAGIYAAGNCAETIHRVTGRPFFSALGTTAAKQGRVVGENLAGMRSTFPGSLETSIEKAFDVGVASTGLTLREALEANYEADSVRVESDDRAGYYPGASQMTTKLVFDRRNGRLLGGQIVGKGSAPKRIDTLAAALAAGLDVQALSQLDLAYAPPYGTLWDPWHIAAHLAMRRIRH